MKKRLAIIYTTVIGVAIILFTIAVFRQKENEREKARERNLMPYKFYSLNGSIIKAPKKLSSNICIIYFDPECDHCEFETKEIINHINLLNNTDFVMVSSNTRVKILDFINKFKLNKYPQFTILQDKDRMFYKWFGHSEVPSIFIYDKNQHLKHKFIGETRFEAILKLLQ